MAAVVTQLPREPLSITGEIEVTRRHGTVVRKLGFEMNLDFGAAPPSARYTLRDPEGKDLARLSLAREASNVVSRFETGNPMRETPVPDSSVPVLDTDMTWQDLTLSFLWWRQGKVLGEDVVKGRACQVVELDAPPGEPPGKVKLWVDRQVPMMLQAEAYDAKGKKVRSLWVKSFRKIKERWMVREMEIQQEPPSHRTHITVTDLDGRRIGEADAEDRIDPRPVGDAGAVTNSP
jgi:hypothetical protein